MSDRHQAPRRTVLSVRRTGTYATTQWLHALDCGHTEARKRRAPRPQLGCTACVAAERTRVATFRQLATLPDDAGAAMDDRTAETLAVRAAATIAARLGIPVDLVDVRLEATSTGLDVAGATAWVPADIVKQLASR